MTRRANRSLMMWRNGQNCQLSILVIIVGLIVAVTLLFPRKSGIYQVKQARIHDHVSEILENEAQPKPNPTVEFIHGTEVIWQIPTTPKAVLFVAHGCDCSPRYFWASCPRCPNCVGLPEETQIVRDALAENYAVIVIKSTYECWSHGKDGPKVKQIISLWLEKNDLVNLPLVGLGASSGGYFLSVLATEIKFRVIVLMIASGLYDQMVEIPVNYPPTLFVHMPKDVNRRRKIDRHIKILTKAGIEVREIKCMEVPLKPNWLADRISGIDRTTSSKLFKLFHDKGFIDANGFMKNDGRVTPWKEALRESNLALPYGSASLHYIDEELNLAYGYHEMTSLQSDQIFEWLNSHIQ